MIYIASPYTHPNPAIRAERFIAVREYTHRLMQSGQIVFSPIVYGHQFSEIFAMPFEAEPWEEFNHGILKICHKVHVLMLNGFLESKGIKAEVDYALSLNKPVQYVTE